jgi:hypothetical protein
MTKSELPSTILIRFYGLEDSDIPKHERKEARRAARKLRKDEVLAAHVLRTVLEIRLGRPLEDSDHPTAHHRTVFLAGANGRKPPPYPEAR